MSGRNGDYRLEDVAAFEAASRGMFGSLQVLARFKGTYVPYRPPFLCWLCIPPDIMSAFIDTLPVWEGP